MVQVKSCRWIVLRGLGRGQGHWGSFQNKMRSKFPNDKIYFLDLPGNGYLNNKISPLNISNYIDDLYHQLNQTDFFQSSGDIYGVGLSLGGMVMTEWAQQNPKFFRQLFLLNTSASNFSKPWHRISIPVFLNAIKQAFVSEIETFEMNSLSFTTNLNQEQILNPPFLENFEANVRFSQKYPISKMNVIRQLFAAAVYFFPEEIQPQVILLNGGNDRFVNPRCSLDIQKKWNCILETHPTAGHDLGFEVSDWVLEVLAQYSKVSA